MPRKDRIFAALVEDQETFESMEGVFGGRVAGLDLSAFRPKTHRRLRYAPSSTARHWSPHLAAEIDYAAIGAEDVKAEIRFSCEHSGTSHGLDLWFEMELCDGVGYSTCPWLPLEERGSTNGVAFLPWSSPVRMLEAEDYQLMIEVNAAGECSGKLYRYLNAVKLLQGSFDSDLSGEQRSCLSAQESFEPYPNIKAYRCAFQGLEKGERAKKVVQRILRAAPHLKTPQAARNILLKCAKMTQIPSKPGKRTTTKLEFQGIHIQVQTDSAEILGMVKERLSPSWKPRRRQPDVFWQACLTEVLFDGGTGFRLRWGQAETVRQSLDDALSRLENLAVEQAVGNSGRFLLLECPSRIVNGEGTLFLSAEHGRNRTILNLAGEIVSYATPGGQLQAKRPVPILTIAMGPTGGRQRWCSRL